MPKFGHLDPDLSKINVKFEFSTFEICYTQNFVKIRKFGPNLPNLSCQICEFELENFQKQITNLKSAHSK